MDQCLAVDFGSTYTKAVVFDLAHRGVAAVSYAPSTVGQDVRLGLERVLADLELITGTNPRALPCLACSSAGGGLRLAVVGLVPSLSLEAAQRAALGAGAKVVGAFGFKLAPRDIARIVELAPDIVLLAGGIDGGDEETVLHNASALARSRLSAPVIVAGNRVASEACAAALGAGDKAVILCSNILPEIDRIEVAEVHAAIRELFMARITRAKGIDAVTDILRLAAPIIPTPSAVLEAARLLAKGADEEAGLGDLAVIDIGGATTDVHSMASGLPRSPAIIQRGLPELYAKRTVEGDLGMRISAPTVAERTGMRQIHAALRELSVPATAADDATIHGYVQRVSNATNYVPQNDLELALDAAIGRAAVGLAMRRHAGRVRDVFTPAGTVQVQEGKDLTELRTLIGIGGVLARGPHAGFVLRGALSDDTDPAALGPRQPGLYLDRDYILFGIGLLAGRSPRSALGIAKARLTRV